MAAEVGHLDFGTSPGCSATFGVWETSQPAGAPVRMRSPSARVKKVEQ